MQWQIGLQQCGIHSVAMESTSVYWIRVYQILESRGFEVYLINATYHLLSTKQEYDDSVFTGAMSKIRSAPNSGSADKLPNSVFRSFPLRTADVPWESVRSNPPHARHSTKPARSSQLCGFVRYPFCD